MRCYACLPLKQRVRVKTSRGRPATEIINWLQSLLLWTTADRRTIWNSQLSVMSMCAAGICCQVVSSCILYYRSISFSLLARHSNSLLSSWRSSPITTSSHNIIAAEWYETNSRSVWLWSAPHLHIPTCAAILKPSPVIFLLSLLTFASLSHQLYLMHAAINTFCMRAYALRLYGRQQLKKIIQAITSSLPELYQ